MTGNILLHIFIFSITSVVGGVIGSLICLSMRYGPRDLWDTLKYWWIEGV